MASALLLSILVPFLALDFFADRDLFEQKRLTEAEEWSLSLVGQMTLRMWVWPRDTIPSLRCLATLVLGITSRRKQCKWHGRFLPLSWAYQRIEYGSVYLKQMMMHTICGKTRWIIHLSLESKCQLLMSYSDDVHLCMKTCTQDVQFGYLLISRHL